MLKLSDLALRPDIQIGPMLVSPSRRLVEGPGGHAHVEPLIMQVFLLLLDGAGRVVTRNELFDQCWGGVYVGDDSLNRAIAKVRRTGAQVAPGLYEIETIPRTGYRLTGQILALLRGASADIRQATPISRRVLVTGGVAAAGLTSATGAWFALRPRSDPRFDALMARGDEAFRNGSAFEDARVARKGSPSMTQLYEQAVSINPDSERAWGLLAYFRSLSADEARGPESARLTSEAQAAIRRALDIDPKEPNARVGLFLLKGPMLDWAARDRQLRDILATDPDNLPAMLELMTLLQAVGLTRESWIWNERALEASPFLKACLVVRAMKLWILGRTEASDKVVDRVRGLWPLYPFGFFVRLMLFVLTDRPQAALAMIDGSPPGMVPNPSLWRAACAALETRTGQAIEEARKACIQVAEKTPWSTNMAVMVLGALGLVDLAFEITDGYLLWRGKVVSGGQADPRDVNDYSRRMTQWLFTPPCTAMRADPRFLKLCDEFGLTDYWRARGVKPDYQV